MNLERMLHSQGFGSRKQCRALIEAGRVALDGEPCLDWRYEQDWQDTCFHVDETEWRYRAQVYLMLHKPAGYECSQQPQHHASVFALLPEPLRLRGVQPAGRLDQDTTGLLLLSDDGPWLHALMHPRRHVPKRYQAQLKHPLDDAQLHSLQSGVLLHGESVPLAAQDAQRVSERSLSLTIEQGKYHQVKRMVAAAGNRVEGLHRAQIGCLTLGELPLGAWRYLSTDEVGLATQAP